MKSSFSTSALSRYLARRDEFYIAAEIPIRDIGISIAHNAATNAESSPAVFINQEYSLTKLLENGVGLELDLHVEGDELMVCHSYFPSCTRLIMDARPFADALAEISAFHKANPSRFIFVNFDDSALNDLAEAEKTKMIEQLSSQIDRFFPARNITIGEYESNYEHHCLLGGDCKITPKQPVIFASEWLGKEIQECQDRDYKTQNQEYGEKLLPLMGDNKIAEAAELAKQHSNMSIALKNIVKSYEYAHIRDGKNCTTGYEAARSHDPFDKETCDFFTHYRDYTKSHL